jgi:hypothetical protein
MITHNNKIIYLYATPDASVGEFYRLKEAIVKIDTVLKGKLPANQKEYFIQYKQDVTKELENK